VAPIDVLETQKIDIKPQAGRNVIYPENGLAVFEIDAFLPNVRRGSLS
jgi:hypothetical protein